MVMSSPMELAMKISDPSVQKVCVEPWTSVNMLALPEKFLEESGFLSLPRARRTSKVP